MLNETIVPIVSKFDLIKIADKYITYNEEITVIKLFKISTVLFKKIDLFKILKSLEMKFLNFHSSNPQAYNF